MQPADRFDESNQTLNAPVDAPDVKPLAVYSSLKAGPDNMPEIITRWTPNDVERANIADGGSVWVRVLGRGLQPMAVTACDPFKE